MDEEGCQDLVTRDIMIMRGNSIKSDLPGLSDTQVLRFVEVFYIIDMCNLVESSHPLRIHSLQLLRLIFKDFEEEILAEPPTLAFTELPVSSGEEENTSEVAEEALTAIRQAESIRVSRINAQNPLGEPSTTSAETPTFINQQQPKGTSNSNSQACAVEASFGPSTVPVKMSEANMVDSDNKPRVCAVKSTASPTKTSISMTEANSMFGSNTKAQDRGVKLSGVSSRIPVTMTKMVGSNSKIQSDGVESSASSTKARLNWEQSEPGDPFGVRVSTDEFGTMPPPFELALTGKFHNARDNIMYLSGSRDATAHFEELRPQIIQPLQPGVDLTPEPVKAYMAANTARKEAAEAEMKATKAKEFNVVGAQEITTGRGLRKEFKNVEPTYAETMFAAIAAAKLEPTQAGAYAKLSDESLREIRAELKAKGKDYTSVPMEEEEAPAKSYVHPSADAPTEDDEAPARSWIHPVTDRVIDKAQMHYDMMYGIVTQMQRDRLELGPEVSDYEVIATAHAGYVAADKAEAARLARAAETQKTKGLACSVGDELRKAQEKGLPITRIGGLELTQKDITDVLERCEQVGGSSSAANDYINAKKTDFKDFYIDPFTKPEDLNPAESSKPFTVKDLISGARAGIAEYKAPPGHFNTAVEKIEKDLEAMKVFRSRIGTTPRDFSKEIEEIEKELAELKAHRAKAPGDLVPDSIDGSNCSIGIDDGIKGDDAEKPEKESTPKKTKSRAEQRRAARQKAKGKAKE